MYQHILGKAAVILIVGGSLAGCATGAATAGPHFNPTPSPEISMPSSTNQHGEATVPPPGSDTGQDGTALETGMEAAQRSWADLSPDQQADICALWWTPGARYGMADQVRQEFPHDRARAKAAIQNVVDNCPFPG